MALDFPNNPTPGEVFTVGDISYVWNGYAWAGGGTQPQPHITSVSDTPPPDPKPGQSWWESDTGRMYVNYNDGTGPAQWVQTNAIPFLEPPGDGGEYVRVNGVWRLKAQNFNVSGLTSQDVSVPAGAKQMFLRACAYQTNTSATCLAAHVSLDGTTFLNGAANYNYVGPTNSLGTTGYSTMPGASVSQMFLSFNGVALNIAHLVQAQFQLHRNANGINDVWTAMVHSQVLGAQPGTSYFTTMPHKINVNPGAAGLGLSLQKFRFYLMVAGTPQLIGPASYLTIEWTY